MSEQVTIAQIATRQGVSTTAVYAWRVHPAFPEVCAHVANADLYDWPAVLEWLRARNEMREVV